MTTARCRHQSGFTLLELLVAMTLLGLLAGILFGGLSFGSRVWEKGEESLQRLDDVQIARNVMQRELSRAFPFRLQTRDGDERVAFDGTGTALNFVGPAPAQSLSGGLYRVHFGAQGTSKGRHLVMTYAPLDPDAEDFGDDDGENVKQAILLKDITSLDFQFFGVDRDGDLPRWVDEWKDIPFLPLLVRIRVEFDDDDRRVWPGLVVAPMLELQQG